MADQDKEGNEPRQRSLWRRIVIAVLNVIAPGAGALRLGQLRLALIAVAISLALPWIFNWLPGRGHEVLAAAIAIGAVLIGLSVILLTIALGWRRSRTLATPQARSASAPFVVLFCLAYFGLNLLRPDSEKIFKSYYIPSSGMAPTLKIGDRFWADMRHPADVRRGDIVVVRHGKDAWVKRLIAIGGDTVAIKDGVPVVNGVRPTLRPDGMETADGPVGAIAAKRFVETVEGRSRVILDFMQTDQDNMPEVRVPLGTVYLLGDNRDNSEDSRFDPLVGGLGFVPVTDIIGRPFFRWFSKAGSPLGSLADK